MNFRYCSSIAGDLNLLQRVLFHVLDITLLLTKIVQVPTSRNTHFSKKHVSFSLIQ